MFCVVCKLEQCKLLFACICNPDIITIISVDGAITPELRQEICFAQKCIKQKVDVDGWPEIAKTHVAATADEWESACSDFRNKK